MPEPTSTTAAVTMVAAGVSIPVLSAFGVPLGLRADLLIAGFFGSLVAIILLNSVPSTGDTWEQLVRTTMRRMFVAFASSVTAGYLTPLVLLLSSIPDPLLLSVAFATGGGAQKVLMSIISRISGQGGAS
ncbi:MAG: hypothetical protein B7Y56_02965 [Gallionellales bacterium 35-53-114]|jgi:hypothetical protein|nr:MAG: hypothetical protein B7Y56_02965 [Gallionellales bacterium 35-53-114]OYZ65068.1 MAG: hypothetical protein B7Y04_00125 [Gallionellales bacterium 24-53-125]OZB07977.1 MAG: hypothetical protein B7X61_10575 [Gallionellales bacterium 39-52-133]HQS59717.1 hypothetical protein [Gallionellaceae bacterium]HQS76471.1 hypothetical protein [Gallionellaceae bacterium]